MALNRCIQQLESQSSQSTSPIAIIATESPTAS